MNYIGTADTGPGKLDRAGKRSPGKRRAYTLNGPVDSVAGEDEILAPPREQGLPPESPDGWQPRNDFAKQAEDG